jgi:hypothetical protein
MEQNIRVRPAQQPLRMGNLFAADDQFSIFYQFMDIVTKTYAQLKNPPDHF